ncbi:alpha/beta hydrolase fold domain-containing protein [Fusobacterium hominis]|uniref:alpha/beta hydrolase fold domain-containing protein n=1 Tax=Fusobacterium hominis TaxID=2764326 RepID=UPI0022E795AB|nr:alpha/beta hydrolase fold domain-containing protein [Fusobacterium hominis]
MSTMKEYILLSILSYCNFSEDDYGQSLWDIFQSKRINNVVISTFDVLLLENRQLFLEYFTQELKIWKVFYVDNRTVVAQDSSVSGFYSVVLKKDNEYVISYRGSEKFPLEDAYKDFIETDLLIGMGRIPLQFYEGIEVYDKITKNYKIDRNQIVLTGHSLGGGIAQYVSMSIDKRENFIPKTYTWNGIGINRKGIVSVVEFIDLMEILKKNTDLTQEELLSFKTFTNSYLSFLFKELKRIGLVKDEVTIIKDRLDKVDIDINEDFIKRLMRNTNIEECLMKFSLKRRRNIVLDQRLFGVIFQIDNLKELLLRAQKFINKVDKNKSYERSIINYGHSQDLTNSLFRHIGSSYLLDQDFINKTDKKLSFLNNFKVFTKSIQDLHFEDVFLAFIETQGDNKGNFSSDINLDFLASSIRKMLTMEYCFSKNFLAIYYSLENVTEENFEFIRKEIVHGFEHCGVELLYRDKMSNQVKTMDISKLDILWEKLKKKLPSPYRYQDIFDIFVFGKK